MATAAPPLPGLASIDRATFLKSAYGDDLSELLKKNKLTTRNLFEMSSATTQCVNTIGDCDSQACKCWICGEPIFLDNNGIAYSPDFIARYVKSGKDASRVKFIKKNKISKDILPQCEHILPVMQAFLILGGLYWSETYEVETATIKDRLSKEYAWSHAYCNNQKDDTNLFDDDGNPRMEEIARLLNKIYAKVKPIRLAVQKRFGGGSKAPTKWIKQQQKEMIAEYLEPLASVYKDFLKSPEEGLHLLSSVATPVHHIEVNLRKYLPGKHKLLQVLEKYKPEQIERITISEWAEYYRTLAREQKKIEPELFSKDIYKGLKMTFISDYIVELYKEAQSIGSNERVRNKETNKQTIIDFITKLIDLNSCIGDRPSPRKYIDEYIPNCTNKFVKNSLDEGTLYGIIILVNEYINNQDTNQELFILSIVQTYILFKLLFEINKLSSNDDGGNMKGAITQLKTDGIDSVEVFKQKLQKKLVLSIEILMNKQSNDSMNPENPQIYINLIQFILSSIITEGGESRPNLRYQQFAKKLNNVLPESLPSTMSEVSESIEKLRTTPLSDDIVGEFEKTLGAVKKASEIISIVGDDDIKPIRENPEIDLAVEEDEINEAIELSTEVAAAGEESVEPLTPAEIEATNVLTFIKQSPRTSPPSEKEIEIKDYLDALQGAKQLANIKQSPSAEGGPAPTGGYKNKTRKTNKGRKTNKTNKTNKTRKTNKGGKKHKAHKGGKKHSMRHTRKVKQSHKSHRSHKSHKSRK